MPGRKRHHIQPEDVRRWLSQGYGQGERERYKPWIRVQDFPSRGTSTKLPLVTVHRTAHLLSRLEFRIALFLDFLGLLFYEQYPLLPVRELEELAQTLGIRYPRYCHTTTPFVLTTDFLVAATEPSGNPYYIAIEAKYLTEFQRSDKHPRRLARTLELLELKRRWLSAANVRQVVWTNESIPRPLFLNLKVLNQAAHRTGAIRCEKQYAKFLDALATVDWQGVPLGEVVKNVAAAIHWPEEDTFLLFKHLVWHHYIDIDLTQVIDRRQGLERMEIRWDERDHTVSSASMLRSAIL